MRVIPQVAINDVTLTANSLTEPFVASAYNSGTTYGFHDLVSQSGLIYLSLQSSNNNNDPSISPLFWEEIGPVETAWNSGTAYVGGEIVYFNHRLYVATGAGTNKNPYAHPELWEDVGPTNARAMFDSERDTTSLSASPLTFTITPGQRINSIGFLDVDADSIQVQVTIPGTGLAYNQTFLMKERTGVINGYTYFYNPFVAKKRLVLFELPYNTQAQISVTILRSSGKIRLGAVVVGTWRELGAAQHDGATNAQLNFSTIENDALGNSVLVKQRAVAEPEITTWLPAYLTDDILNLRDQLNAEPALWCGVEDSDAYFFRALCVLGVYIQFDVGLPYKSHSVLALKLREI